MSKQTEIESIYQSYEWLIRERLDQLDTLSRNMYREMAIFGISVEVAAPYVHERMTELMNAIIEKGDKQHVKNG